MASRRSVSFELLAVDSPGDGDGPGEFQMSEDGKTVGKSKKRRRRSKSLKVVSDSHMDALVEEKDFGLSRVRSSAEARPESLSPSNGVLRWGMQADKGKIQGSGSTEIRLGSVEETPAATSKSLLVWPLQARQFEPSITNVGIRELVFAQGSPRPFAELRQQSVVDKSSDMSVEENGIEGGARGRSTKLVSFKEQQMEADPSYLGHVDAVEPPGYRNPPPARQPLASYVTPHLTEWDHLMAANSDYPTNVDISPLWYLQREVQRGSALEHHSSVNMEQKWGRVYNTMFHVPWRCELVCSYLLLAAALFENV